jgi:uncharacterized membrane protein
VIPLQIEVRVMAASQRGKSGKSRKASAGAGREEARAAKREQFTQERRRSPLGYVLAALAVVAALAAGAVFAMRGGDAAPPAQGTAQAAEVNAGRASVPVADLEGGAAKFFSADAGGTTVKYFLVEGPDGTVRAAFDACDVCYPAKKGYTQDGDVMVCNNCGRRFPTASIGKVAGGCNPSPLKTEVKGGEVQITADALATGVQYFQ